MIKTGEVMTVENGYGVRLIEQGKAVAAVEMAAAKAQPKADAKK